MELIINKNINYLLNIPCVKNEQIVFKTKIRLSKNSSHYDSNKAEKNDA